MRFKHVPVTAEAIETGEVDELARFVTGRRAVIWVRAERGQVHMVVVRMTDEGDHVADVLGVLPIETKTLDDFAVVVRAAKREAVARERPSRDEESGARRA